MGNHFVKLLRFVLQTGFIAGLYLLLAAISGAITIQPENLTLVRLAAAFAFAAVYISGFRAAAGIFLGAFIYHAWLFGPSRYGSAAGSALLTSAQAILTIYLARRWIGDFPEKPVLAHLVRFAIITAVSSGLIVAIQVSALNASGLFPSQTWAGQFTRWFLSNWLSVVFFGPVLVSLYETRLGKLSAERSIAMVTGLGTIFCALTFITVWNVETGNIQHQFRSDASITAAKMQAWVDEGLIHLESFGGLYNSSDTVTRSEFERYYFRQLQHAEHPGFLGMEWAPRVTDEERAVFEEAIRREGYPEFQISQAGDTGGLAPAARREVYFPVVYHVPGDWEPQALGYDLGSDSEMLSTLQMAAGSTRPAATGFQPRVQFPATRSVTLVFLPIYKHGAANPNTRPDPADLLGYVVGLYQISSLLDAHLADQDTAADIEIALRRTAGGPVANPVYAWPETGAKTATASGDPGAEWIYNGQLVMYDQAWDLEIQPARDYFVQRRTHLPWTITSIGLVFLMITVYLMEKRQQTTAHLAESQSRYKSLFEDSPLGLWEVDFSGVKFEVDKLRSAGVSDFDTHFKQNPQDVIACISKLRLNSINLSAIQMFGSDTPIEIERSIIHWLSTTALAKAGHLLALLAGGDLHFETEETIHTRQGDKTVLLQVNVIPPYRETLERVLVSSVDVTQARQTEMALRESMEKYRVIFESFPLGITISDAEGNIVEANRESERILGVSINEHIGRQLDGEQWRVLRPDGSQMPPTEFASLRALRENCLVENVEMGVERPDKSVRWITVTAAPIPLKNYGVAVTYSDITARRIAEQTLNELMAGLEKRVEERTTDLSQANLALARAMHTRDEFLASVSHELRTPLNGILGLSESLLEETRGPLNPAQMKSLEGIEQSGRHLLALINDILDFSKIEAGRIEIHKDVVVVKDACEASLLFIRDLARKKELNIQFIQDERDLQMAADPRRLKQILINLLSNAVKFTPAGGEVLLQARRIASDGVIEFMVKDSGIGMPADFIPRLFEPFTQFDSSLSRQYEGTGLGLALVKRLVEQHGGSISAESDGPGKGSTFTLRLPQLDDLVKSIPLNAQPAPLPAQANVRPTEPSGITRRPLILLAEDNEINILAMADYLEYSGYRVLVARNGQDALDTARRESPDLILMDIQIPGLSGIRAIETLRMDARFRATPILAITALALPGDRERCLQAGADDYLAKPISMRLLASAIRAQLEKLDREQPATG